MVYSKPLGGKSRIVKLVREMKKKIGSFTWAVLYVINPPWLKLPISRTHFHSPKDFWAIEVRIS